MSQIGTKLRRASWPAHAGGPAGVKLMHWCPGCDQPHGITIEGGPPIWTFDGNYDAPTFSPSILCFVTHTTDDDDKPLPVPVRETLCHYFIKAGMIEFCGDSPHKLKGQTVPLPDWPYAPGGYGGIED
jgi:hypothetical protein